MEEFKKWLQEFVNKYPGTKYLIQDNGEPNWESIFGESKQDVNNIPFPALRAIVESKFIHDIYYE